MDDEHALVVTTDFITPLVDEPRDWGRIAAANAASDVYAMGGRPMLALNLVGWNGELGNEVLGDVLAGGQDAGKDGGWVTVGGHTVDDPEPKYGLAVVGEVHPDRVTTNAGLRDGDALVLTKPVGTGVIATALKAEACPAETARAAVASMTRLNDEAAETARQADATGATDVTGFGLLGHLGEMAHGSGLSAEIDAGAVPVLPGVRELAADGFVPGGSESNLAWARERMDEAEVDKVTVALLADAQTSGGLLFGAGPQAAGEAVERLHASGHDAAVIGQAVAGTPGALRVSG
jgi:selenide,water dikinase